MKKTFLIALFFAATLVQAASFKWSAATNAKFEGTALAGNATGYLVYLGTTGTSADLFTVDYTAPGTITPADTVQNVKSGEGRAAGAISATYKDTETGADGHHVYTGAKFGMFITYTDGDGTTWYNFSDTVASITTDATGAFEAKSFSFDYSTKTQITSSDASPSAGGGWYSISVPEPSVALMGLLGLGMLLKRRRA